MSTVNSFIYINPIEPAPLSLRVPSGVQTQLDVTFYDQLGVVYSTDVAAQLELTPRTNGGPQIYYPMPGVDIVNGKARAVFGANTLIDRNGYHLNLYGTVRNEPMLIARGTIDVLETPGTMTVPVDIIDTIDLSFDRDEDVALDVKLWTDAGKGVPLDLTVVSVSANIYASKAGTLLMPFLVTVVAANEVRLTLTADQVNALPDYCWWTMVASTGAGLTTLCEGSVTVSGVVTPGLSVTTAMFDYQKPASGSINPVGGQIIHGAIEQNLLKVSKTTEGLQDFTPTLVLVEPGDQVQIDVTLWTVITTVEAAGWYEFRVSPVQQAAVTGSTLVTFSRP